MNPIDAMQAFVRVTELASFTRAADSLGLPKASVSIAIRQLENQLGAQLLHRTTRRVQPTQDGQAFYARCKELLGDLDELQSMFQHDKQCLRGRLRVDMPISIANRTVIPRLADFLRDHPQLEIELSSTDRKVDLIAEGFDCVLRVGVLDDSSLVARTLGSLRIVNCVSPAYLREHGVPRTLDDLPRHWLVHYANTLGSRPLGFEYRDGVAYRHIAMRGVITVNNTEAYEAACLAGLGIIQAPEAGVRPLLESGAMVEVMPEYRAEAMPMSFLYAQRHNLPRRTQVFMAWLGALLAPSLEGLSAL
ncbi:LysR family transcriptional regulator [Dyella sp. GSA-30]|uniref:LysR family transcriptional regulator n=1 Tax=Dyella sp. GSA-30 TaxID=2994496 RepID=UPI002491E3EA|nr:LysR family transcriptional regulator [Dyella sp. GSA-30]